MFTSHSHRPATTLYGLQSRSLAVTHIQIGTFPTIAIDRTQHAEDDRQASHK